MVILKTSREIAKMRQAGRISQRALQAAGKAVEPGVSTYEIDCIVREYIEKTYGYDLHKTYEYWHSIYHWESSCQGTVPQAIIAFLESENIEDAIRKAVSLGGDSDTLACITGGIAEAFYKEIPKAMADRVYLHFPKIFHKRGAIAAARKGDMVNPQKNSSGSQFYIVWGSTFSSEELNKLTQAVEQRSRGTVKFTDEIKKEYLKTGGTPHLDGGYTVFGEVIEGLSVVGKIQEVRTDNTDRPFNDIRIITAEIIK